VATIQKRLVVNEEIWDLIPSRDHHIHNGSGTHPPFNQTINESLFQEYTEHCKSKKSENGLNLLLKSRH
jgi:hypothetical protein